jgi:hypothetical protein
MAKKPETYESRRKYGNIEVGQFYQCPEDIVICPINGIAEITDIRFWSDGMRDVELRQGSFTAYVRLDLLMRENPGSGKSLFSRVENPGD